MSKKKKNICTNLAMTPEDLQLWLHFRKKCAAMDKKKGKGSYSRKNYRLPEY